MKPSAHNPVPQVNTVIFDPPPGLTPALDTMKTTPIEALAADARYHYHRMAMEQADWMSLIPHAIGVWERQEQARRIWWRRLLLKAAL